MKQMKRILTGMAFGAMIDCVAMLIMSYALELGYLAPCISGLPELVGGELNGAAVQLLLAMLAGAGIAYAAGRQGHQRPWVRGAVALGSSLPIGILLIVCASVL